MSVGVFRVKTFDQLLRDFGDDGQFARLIDEALDLHTGFLVEKDSLRTDDCRFYSIAR